jgi:AcrR family transcriptional regulator
MVGTFDRRFRKTEDTITQALIRLLNEKNVQEITLSELIQEADINKSTFYLHYQNLDDLVEALENNGLTLIRSFFAMHSLSKDGSARDLVLFVYDNRLLFNALSHAYSFRLHGKLYEFFNDFMAHTKNVKPKKTLDEEGMVLSSLLGSLLSILSSWLDQSCHYAKEKVIVQIDGLLSEPAYKDLINR